MLSDYDELWDILEENYPYFDILRKRGINLNFYKENYRKMVANSENFDEFHQILLQLLAFELQSEGHLNLIYSEIFPQLKDVFFSPETSPIKDKKVYKYIQEPFFDNKVIQRYEIMAKRQGLNTFEGSTEDSFLEIFKREKDKTLIIKYDSFYTNKYEENAEEIRKALLEYPYENIVIDIRENYGGWLINWFKIVELLIDEDINYDELYLSKGKMSKEIYEEAHFVDFKLERELESESYVVSVPFEIKSKKEIDYNPNIYLLVGRKSYSASLKFANFAKENNFAKIMGRKARNGGDGGSSYGYNLLTYKLPKSNLLFQFFTNIRCLEDGTPLDPTIEPDYIIQEKASYDDIIKAINRNRKN